MTIRKYISTFVSLILLFASSCQQLDWLDISNDKALILPSTLNDYQAILDNDLIMNANYPAMGLIGADNQVIKDDKTLGMLTERERNAYLWEPDIYNGFPKISDWNAPYQVISSACIVLDGLKKSVVRNAGNGAAYDRVKGAALFFRAFSFYKLSQLFCKPYNASTAGEDLGIPLRLTSDVNIQAKRSTVEETYRQIIKDLKEALPLLAEDDPYINRPTKAAADALLAKVYLAMEDYPHALEHANTVLAKKDALLDFNALSSEERFPFSSVANGKTENGEIIFYATSVIYSTTRTYSTRMAVNPELMALYDEPDLRRSIFYENSRGYDVFKASYSGSSALFSGLSTNEIYLIRAECNARMGNGDKALKDLNFLLAKRYKSDEFTPYGFSTSEEVLGAVLKERRKELPFTGQVRWEDLRRLNQDPRFSTTLKRSVNSMEYTLLPSDPRYVLPIPDYEIQLNDILQNER